MTVCRCDGDRRPGTARASSGSAPVGSTVAAAASRKASAISATIGIVFGGPSTEHDVSVITGLQAVHALAGAGHEVVAIYWSKLGAWWRVDPGLETVAFADGVPKGAEPLELLLGSEGGFRHPGRRRRAEVPLDVVVNACHGGPGEDGTLQGLLDLAGLAYTGPDRAGAALAMDKLAFGSLLASRLLPQLPRISYAGAVDTPPAFSPPFIVKPRAGGSSVGVQVVSDLDTLTALVTHDVHLRGGAVVEPYLADAVDLNIALRTYPDLQLSAIERPLRAAGSTAILGFQDKYTAAEGMAGAARQLPAELPADLEAELRRHAEVVASQLPVRGVARLDFLLHDDRLYVNELNTVPGSLAKYLWVDPPVAFAQLLADQIAEARARPTYRPVTEGADGRLLRDAGSIAAKLR